MVQITQPLSGAYDPWPVEGQLAQRIDNPQSPNAMRMLMGYINQRQMNNSQQQGQQQQVLGMQAQAMQAEQQQHRAKTLVDILRGASESPGAAQAYMGSTIARPYLEGVDLAPVEASARLAASSKAIGDLGRGGMAGYFVDPGAVSQSTGLPVHMGQAPIVQAAALRAAGSGGGNNSDGPRINFPMPPASGLTPTPQEIMSPTTVSLKLRPGETPDQARARAISGGAPSVMNNAPARPPAATATPQSSASATTTQTNGTNTQQVQGRAIKALNDLLSSNRGGHRDVIAGSRNGQPNVISVGDGVFMQGASGTLYPVQ